MGSRITHHFQLAKLFRSRLRVKDGTDRHTDRLEHENTFPVLRHVRLVKFTGARLSGTVYSTLVINSNSIMRRLAVRSF